MFYGMMGLFAALIVVADQVSKYFVVQSMALYETKPLLSPIVELLYVRNPGMAWSMLSGARWLFVAVTFVAIGAVCFAIWKKMITKRFELFCIAAIIGGGIGNLIDRVLYGEVVDMLHFQFFDFPVFNVADCFVSCGCVLLVIFVLFFDRDGKEKTDDSGK